MKNEKGITLMVLSITIIIMVILAGAAITYGSNSLNTTKLQNFSYELQQIQGKVDILYEKIRLGEDDYITLGRNITESKKAVNALDTVKRINYSSITDKGNLDYYTENRTNTL